NGVAITPANVIFPQILVHKQGTPEHLFNLLARYKWDNGIGFSANLLITSEYNLSYNGDAFALVPSYAPIHMQSVIVPWQHTLDIQLFYRSERFEASIVVLNATDQKNFSPAHPV